MRRALSILAALAVCLWLLAGFGNGMASAQDVTQGDVLVNEDHPATPEEALADITPVVDPNEGMPDFANLLPDYEAWEEVATRAERLVLRNAASRFALNRQRESLVVWRDAFSSLLGKTEGRIATLTAQIAALGEAPADGANEPPSVTQRRDALATQLASLRGPALLVEEGFARANGLISEIDAMIRQRETAQLLVRGPSPLNPEYWAGGMTALWQGLRDFSAETVTALRNDIASGEITRKLPLVFLYVVLAFLLLNRQRRWLASDERETGQQDKTTQAGLRRIGANLAQLVVPVIGLVALTLAILTIAPTGVRSRAVFDAVPTAGLMIVAGRWLGFQFFPTGANPGLLGYDLDTRRRARRVSVLLAWIVGVWLPLIALLDSGAVAQSATAVVNLPVIVVLGVLLFRLGQLLRRAPDPDLPEGHQQQGRIRGIVGQFCQVVAVAAPVAAGFGFAAAAEGVMLPTLMSLAVLALVIVLQHTVNDLYGIWARARGRQTEALMPVVVGFVLLILALPVLALIWGARVSELFEVWARFSEGFSLGDTRVSPTDFMTFVLIFVVGYLLTRLVQGTLRTTVLPRTKLDLGAQNAAVSGFGYLGIGLSAIVAITSAGIDLSSLAFVAGALSVGIGFGLQNIVSNFVSGIILLIERPVSEGDWIEVGGQMGYVRDISVRSTRIETFDRTDVIVPNADLVSNQVTNWTRGNLVGRVIVPVGVAYGSDVAQVERILREIAEAHPMVLLEPAPKVYFMNFGASSLDFEIRAILRDVNFVVAARSEMNFEIDRRFREAGIEIPFPQQDVWLRSKDETPAMPRDNDSPQSGDVRQSRHDSTDFDTSEPSEGQT